MAVQIQTLFEYQSKGQPIAYSQPVEKWTACFFLDFDKMEAISTDFKGWALF